MAWRRGTATITATGAHSGKSGTALVSVPEQPPVVTPPVVIQPALLAPGCNIAIQGVTVPADLRAVVAFTATNTKGQTLAKSELSTVRFILAHLATGPAGSTPKYASYTTRIENPDGVADNGDEAIQATYDAAQLNGVTQLADGSFTYRFTTALPADYPMSAVHEVAGQIARLYVIDGLTYPSNPVYKFRPDGVAPGTAGRDIVQTATCNKCHVRLGLHGGQRREIQLCDMCHSPQSTDAQSKNTVDMTAMIHKIHMGEQLPSVEGGTHYQIIGNAGSVNDYSTVVFPQPITNCTACHEDVTKAAQGGVYLTNPTKEACGSCHDRTWFGSPSATPAGFHNHPLDFESPDSSQCAVCHTPTAPGIAPIKEDPRTG